MECKPNRMDAYRLLHDGILAFSRAESYGIRIDTKKLKKKIDKLASKISEKEKRFSKTKVGRMWKHIYGSKLNYNSDHQLSFILYKKLKLEPLAYTSSENPSTDKNVLSKLDVEGLDLLLEIRKWKKARDTYLEGILREQVDGVLRPFFDLHTVRTYRSSSSYINFQNIPKRDKEVMRVVRSVIIPKPGHILVEVDYGSLEVRISTCYHKDPTMVTYIEDPHSDMHRDICMQIYLLGEDKWTSEARFYAKNGFVFFCFLGIAQKTLRGRTNDHQSFGSVYQNRFARAQLAGDVMKPDHRGHLECASHNCSVRGGASLVGCKGVNDRRIHACGIRRREVLRHGNAGTLNLIHAVDHLSGEVFDDPTGDIPYVDGTLAEVVIFDIRKHFDVVPRHPMEDAFDILHFFAHLASHLVDKIAVVHHEQVRIKNTSVLLAKRLVYFSLNLRNLVAGLDQGFVEAGNFEGNLLLGDRSFRNGSALVSKENGFTNRHAGRDTQSLKKNFTERLYRFFSHALVLEEFFLKQLGNSLHSFFRILSCGLHIKHGTLMALNG